MLFPIEENTPRRHAMFFHFEEGYRNAEASNIQMTKACRNSAASLRDLRKHRATS